jgi:uncharacterized protein
VSADLALPFRCDGAGVLLHVRLTPRGGRDAIDGIATGDDGKSVLLARVRAIPEDGAANAALVGLIAKQLHVRKTAVMLVSGGKARIKTLRIEGDCGDIAARIAALCGT